MPILLLSLVLAVDVFQRKHAKGSMCVAPPPIFSFEGEASGIDKTGSSMEDEELGWIPQPEENYTQFSEHAPISEAD